MTPDGSLTQNPEAAYKPGKQDGNRLLDLITNHSLYTMEEELRKGFITIAGAPDRTGRQDFAKRR